MNRKNIMRQWLVLLLCFLSLNAAADGKAFQSQDELGQWVTYYYTHPEPSRVPQAVAYASRMGAFRDGKAAPPFFGFVAGVLSKAPDLAPRMIDELSNLPAGDQPVLVLGVWYSGHKDTKALMRRLAKSMPAQKKMIDDLVGDAPALTDIPLEQGPWVLDALWGEFMATGDEAPVIRIMSALPWIDVRGNTGKLMVGGAAKWSLTSNAVQHPKVLEICESQLSRQPKDVSAALTKVIAEARDELKNNASKAGGTKQ